ncbi:long-chain-fatty-acid--CoA ligase [Streptomyces sp. NPDC048415]|uniref:long-chain-fatty-acid--CoA ligase n=1 Tax=Streptomyces sp. NPDC048415 TaxID=3154822 RepID=UPI0034280221
MATTVTPGQDMTISGQLSRHARTIPDQVAFRFGETDRTYRQLDERVNRLTHALRQYGVGVGDRVALMAYNGLETVEVYFACARLGAICVPVNFRLVADEVAYVLADSGACFFIAEAALADTAFRARAGAPNVRAWLVIGSAAAGTLPDANDYEAALQQASPGCAEGSADEHAPAYIMYTSGTTGRPKGAVLTHHNLFVQTISRIAHLGMPTDCRVWLAATPLFHIAGLAGLFPSILAGGRVVLARSGSFDPVEMVDLLERERIAECFFVPAQWQAICDVPGIAHRDLPIRIVRWGAAPATTTLLRTLHDTFPHAEIESTFGQTECSPVTTVLRGEDALRKIGSVGTPLLNVEVRVVDDEMNDVPQGETGEIVYRGPSVMKEYWNRPRETAEAFTGGWFHSGDLVRQDNDGYFYVVDRKKDMIISGGENIYCAEVENVLAAHPQVAEVAVVGTPHSRWGETPLAVIVPRDASASPTADEIERWCRERMAAYKCPRQIRLASELPRNAMGKVLKTQLRREAGELAVDRALKDGECTA